MGYRFFVLLITSVILIKCSSDIDNHDTTFKPEKHKEDIDTVWYPNQVTVKKTEEVKVIKEEVFDFSHIVADSVKKWYADFDTVCRCEILVRGTLVDSIPKTAKLVIDAFNINSELPIQFKKVVVDTLYVEVLNDDLLTQRMGSSGAGWFMASATFSLTEIKGINSVRFIFEEGDHATPGVRTRSKYEDRFKIIDYTNEN